MTLYRLEELFPHQLEARLADVPILVLPFGTIEWHSHHLPLGLDGLVAQRLGEAIAVALYMLPPLAFVIIVLSNYMRRGRTR